MTGNLPTQQKYRAHIDNDNKEFYAVSRGMMYEKQNTDPSQFPEVVNSQTMYKVYNRPVDTAFSREAAVTKYLHDYNFSL